MVSLRLLTAAALSFIFSLLPVQASTVAWWRFEEGIPNIQMVHWSGLNGVWSPDVPDVSGNGNELSAWTQEDWGGYVYHYDVPATTIPVTGQSNYLSIKNTGSWPGLWNESLRTWCPSAFTIEAAFKPETGGYRTIVGRDSKGAGGDPRNAALYFQIQNDDSVAVRFQDVSGIQHSAISAPNLIKGFTWSSDPEGVKGRWYAMAAVSDGRILSLYLNDFSNGNGYELVAQEDMTLSGSLNTALTAGFGSGGDWHAGDISVGRGLWDGAHIDRCYGFIDEVRLSDTALTPNEFLFAASTEVEVRATVTDSHSGDPVLGAGVTIGARPTFTDSAGKYSVFCPQGGVLPVTVTHYFAEVPYSSTVTAPATGYLIHDVSMPIRPHMVLTTANGYGWRGIINTGGAEDYSAETADESRFFPITVPSNIQSYAEMDDVYIWYRLHFTVPGHFTESMAGRQVIFRVRNPRGFKIDDVDATFLNGVEIGRTGSFPNPPLPAFADWRDNPTPTLFWPGLQTAYGTERVYCFPSSQLKTGDNVIAIKVFNLTGPGGISGMPSLEVADPTATVTGVVSAGGQGIAGFRVSAMGVDGVTTDSALTDAQGAFVLSHVRAGLTTLGAAKPGYQPIIAPLLNVSGGSVISGLSISAAAVQGGAANVYDHFTGSGTDWQAKWTSQSLFNADPANSPTVVMPGIDVNTGIDIIPDTLTIKGGSRDRGALLSKATLDRRASIVSARLVSALPSSPEPTGWMPNVILYLSGQEGTDAPHWALNPSVEMELASYCRAGNMDQRVLYSIWMSPDGGNHASGAVPMALDRLTEVRPTNPVDLTIARTGTMYDFYLNGVLVYSANSPATNMPDHRFAAYSSPQSSATTWDRVLASGLSGATPLPGDLNGNGMVDIGDSVIALRIAGGLQTAATADAVVGDVEGQDGVVTIADAVRLLRAE